MALHARVCLEGALVLIGRLGYLLPVAGERGGIPGLFDDGQFERAKEMPLEGRGRDSSLPGSDLAVESSKQSGARG